MLIQRLRAAGGSQEKWERFYSQNLTISILELFNARILKPGSKLCTPRAHHRALLPCQMQVPTTTERTELQPEPQLLPAALTLSWLHLHSIAAQGLVLKTPPCVPPVMGPSGALAHDGLQCCKGGRAKGGGYKFRTCCEGACTL